MSPSPSPEHVFDVELDQAGLRYAETFATAREGRRVVVSAVIPSQHALSVTGVGGKLTSWTATLQGSLDGVNWTTLVTASGTEGAVAFPGDATPRPVRYVRVNVSALVLGDASSAKVIAVCKA